MKKYDNYIYLTICELTINMVKGTNYSTYNAYCRGIANSIKDDVLSGYELRQMNYLNKMLTLYYGLSLNDTKKYIDAYFLEELWVNYELSARLTLDCFPLSFN